MHSFRTSRLQIAEAEVLDRESEVAERSRAELASVELAERLRGSIGWRIGVHLASGTVFAGMLSHAGAESLVLDEAAHQVLIPYTAVGHYMGIGRLAVGEASAVRRKTGPGQCAAGPVAGQGNADRRDGGGRRAASRV